MTSSINMLFVRKSTSLFTDMIRTWGREEETVPPPKMVPEDTPVVQPMDEQLMEAPGVAPPKKKKEKKRLRVQKRRRKSIAVPLRRPPVTRMMTRIQ